MKRSHPRPKSWIYVASLCGFFAAQMIARADAAQGEVKSQVNIYCYNTTPATGRATLTYVPNSRQWGFSCVEPHSSFREPIFTVDPGTLRLETERGGVFEYDRGNSATYLNVGTVDPAMGGCKEATADFLSLGVLGLFTNHYWRQQQTPPDIFEFAVKDPTNQPYTLSLFFNGPDGTLSPEGYLMAPGDQPGYDCGLSL